MKLSYVAAIAALAGALTACARGAAKTSSNGSVDSAKTASDSGSDSSATPVTMGSVSRANLVVTVSGPGETDAVQDERVRAPFTGVLVSLDVNLGDHVVQGQTIGAIVSQNSEAALQGARSMLRSARSAAERLDAERALALAEHDLVRTPLRAQKGGVVIARPASPGELVAQGDSIVSIAATGSMVFYADIPQSDLARVRPGQPARVELAARPQPIRGVVHAVLPADTGSTVSMRVRIDLIPAAIPVTVGLFGTAHITVAEHLNAIAVPKSALLRDDITGQTKVALVTPQNEAHWVTVTPGISDSAWAEILSPPLRVGQRVITTGQVGLPDSTHVIALQPNDSATAGKGASAGGPRKPSAGKPGGPGA